MYENKNGEKEYEDMSEYPYIAEGADLSGLSYETKEKIVTPYLKEDEFIVKILNNDKENPDSSFAKGRYRKTGKVLRIAVPLITAVTIAVIFMGLSDREKHDISFIFLYEFFSPLFLMFGFCAFLSWLDNLLQDKLIFAITNKRILEIGDGKIIEVPFKNIKRTKARIKHDKGKLYVKAVFYEELKRYRSFSISMTENPFEAKRILDAAIEECKAYQNQD